MSEPRFLNSEVEDPSGPRFRALGQAGSSAYLGLETFDNPGCEIVTYSSDEVVAKCPVTGQPDYYGCEITLRQTERLIESKSLKLFFNNIHQSTFTEDFGIFCEGLAVYIRDTIARVLECDEDNVQVILTQKSRGGISIRALA